MFKATTRRTKGFTFPKQAFEAIIHEAQPRAVFIDPAIFEPAEDGVAYWTVAVPEINGAAIWDATAGQFETEAEALASGSRCMRRMGWRETREEAVADGAVEITRRTTFRADGTPRRKPI